MSGLLTKEILYVKVQKRVLYLLAVIAVLMCFMMSGDSAAASAAFLGVLTAMFSATEVFGSLGCDEKAKWSGYARSLPVSAAQAVGAKYLLALILTAAGTTLGALIELIVMKHAGVTDGNVLLILCAVSGGVSLLLCSVELPLYYRFGYQKSNLMLVLVFCFLPITIGKLGENSLAGITDAQFFSALRLFPAAVLAVMLLSFFLSVWIYSRKEM